MNKKVDTYINNLEHWKDELTELRKLIIECGLVEDFKWKHPCYTHNNKNIVLIHGFKNYCAILFNKGALLLDSEKILIQQTENTQAARQIRFTSTLEIINLKHIIKAYIFEATEAEKSGAKVPKKKMSEFEIPKELNQLFKEHLEFRKAFKNLTEGRQRGYLLHFTQAKQSKTRLSRIEKNKTRILDGYGLNDCTCGLTKRKPNCDGSHKQLR